MEPVRFSKDGKWYCPRCGALAQGQKCPQCQFFIYAGFIPRVIAGLTDGAICWGAAKLFLFLRCNSLHAFLMITVIGFIFYRLYHILFVALWGQTPGKMLARIQVVRLDGSSVGWTHAILRDSVETILAAVLYYFEINAALHIPATDFSAAALEQRETLIKALIPHVAVYLAAASHIYVYSEYVVMWMNQRKRAIHDYIGGTVVIHDPRHTILPWRRFFKA